VVALCENAGYWAGAIAINVEEADAGVGAGEEVGWVVGGEEQGVRGYVGFCCGGDEGVGG